MGRDVFVDTSGFFALFTRRDEDHERAARIVSDLAASKRKLVTTDYVVDETATLLVARGKAHLAESLFESVLTSRSCRVEWMDPTRFDAAQRLFLKHLDQGWSFTDAASIHVMREVRLAQALTKDAHFQHAGFEVLLPLEKS